MIFINYGTFRENGDAARDKQFSVPFLLNFSFEFSSCHRLTALSPVCRFVLAKERNLLQSEKLAYARAKSQMPDPSRLTKVRKGMSRIKHVMSERLQEHEDPTIRMQLKAFIDAM